MVTIVSEGGTRTGFSDVIMGRGKVQRSMRSLIFRRDLSLIT